MVYLFMYLPIMVVVAFSFNDAKRSLVWQGFTLKWYQELLHNVSLWQVAWHSVILGALAATTAAVIGTLIAVSLFRYRFIGRRVIRNSSMVLILVPEIVMAVSLLSLYNFFGISLGFVTLFIAHVVLCMPFVVTVVYSRITTLDRLVFEAAKDLGATDLIIFTKITIPLLWPAIISGWLLSFTLSLDDVIISYFVSGPSFDILPLKIYSMVRLGVKPEVNALCTLMLMVTLVAVIVSYRNSFKKNEGLEKTSK